MPSHHTLDKPLCEPDKAGEGTQQPLNTGAGCIRKLSVPEDCIHSRWREWRVLYSYVVTQTKHSGIRSEQVGSLHSYIILWQYQPRWFNQMDGILGYAKFHSLCMILTEWLMCSHTCMQSTELQPAAIRTRTHTHTHRVCGTRLHKFPLVSAWKMTYSQTTKTKTFFQISLLVHVTGLKNKGAADDILRLIMSQFVKSKLLFWGWSRVKRGGIPLRKNKGKSSINYLIRAYFSLFTGQSDNHTLTMCPTGNL